MKDPLDKYLLIPLVLFCITCIIMIGVHYEEYTTVSNLIR